MLREQGNYVSGLGHKAGVKVRMGVEDGALVVQYGIPSAHLGWRETVPVADISGAVIELADRTSGARVALTGVVGLLWKKTDRFLVIERRYEGMETQVIVTAKREALERLQSAIAQARAAQRT